MPDDEALPERLPVGEAVTVALDVAVPDGDGLDVPLVDGAAVLLCVALSVAVPDGVADPVLLDEDVPLRVCVLVGVMLAVPELVGVALPLGVVVVDCDVDRDADGVMLDVGE